MTALSHDALQGVRLKIERAKTHLGELDRIFGAFHERKPYGVVRDDDLQAGQCHFRIKIVERVPVEASVVIGDVVHNLRSALDLLATELAIVGGGTGKDAYFPFDADPAKFETKWLRSRMGKAAAKALRFVKRLKPYPGGNEALWKLHQLDILDKHKAIVPVGAVYTSVNPDLGSLIPTGQGEMFEKMRDALRKMPIFIRPADRQYPLQDGAILFSCPIPKPDDPQPNPQFRIDIAFGEGQIVDGEPVVPTLGQFIKIIERITNIAQRHFF